MSTSTAYSAAGHTSWLRDPPSLHPPVRAVRAPLRTAPSPDPGPLPCFTRVRCMVVEQSLSRAKAPVTYLTPFASPGKVSGRLTADAGRAAEGAEGGPRGDWGGWQRRRGAVSRAAARRPGCSSPPAPSSCRRRPVSAPAVGLATGAAPAASPSHPGAHAISTPSAGVAGGPGVRRRLFAANCSGCHGRRTAKGRAFGPPLAPAGFARLVGPMVRAGRHPDALLRARSSRRRRSTPSPSTSPGR